jgi:hypothetical protein
MRIQAWMICFGPILVAAPVALVQCSSSSSSNHNTGKMNGSSGGTSGGASSSGVGTSSGGDDGGGTSSGPSSSGGSSGGEEGGLTGEGGNAGEGGSTSGGPAIPVPEGGAPSDPGQVPCGATSCTTSTQFCCKGTGDGGTATCDSYNSGTCPTTSIQVQCNEAADCMGGVCCQALQYGPHSATCMPSCGTANFQVCRTDGECGAMSDAGAAKRCVVQTCFAQMPVGGFPGGPGGGVPGGGTSGGGTPTVTVEACAYPNVGAGGGVMWGPLPNCTAK